MRIRSGGPVSPRRFLLLPFRLDRVSLSSLVVALTALGEYTLAYYSDGDRVVAAVLSPDDVRDQLATIFPRGAVVPLTSAAAIGDRIPAVSAAASVYARAIRLAESARVGHFVSPIGPPTAKFIQVATSASGGEQHVISPLAEDICNKLVSEGGGIAALAVRLSEAKVGEEVKKLRKRAERQWRGVPRRDAGAAVEAELAIEKLREANFDVHVVTYGPASEAVARMLRGLTALRAISIGRFELPSGGWPEEEVRLVARHRGKPLRLSATELAVFWPYLRPERGAGKLVRLDVPAAERGLVPSHPGGIHILDVLTKYGELVELRVPPSAFRSHFIHFARTGAGKTTLMVNLALQFLENRRRVLLIDPNEQGALRIPAVLAAHGFDPEEDAVILDPRFYHPRFNALEAAGYPSLSIHIPHAVDEIIRSLGIAESEVLREVGSWLPYREALTAALGVAYEFRHKPTLVDVLLALEDVLTVENEAILNLIPDDLGRAIKEVRRRYARGDKPASATERARADLAVVTSRLSTLLSNPEALKSLCALDHFPGGPRPIIYDELFDRPRIVAWALPFYLPKQVRNPLMRFLFSSIWLWLLYRSMGGQPPEDMDVIIMLDEEHVLIQTQHEHINELITMARKYGAGHVGFTQWPDQLVVESLGPRGDYLKNVVMSQVNILIFGQNNVRPDERAPLSEEERDLVVKLPDYHALVWYARAQQVFGGKLPRPADADPDLLPPAEPGEPVKPKFRELMSAYAERWGAPAEDARELTRALKMSAAERAARAAVESAEFTRETLAKAVTRALSGDGVIYVPTRSAGREVASYLARVAAAGLADAALRVRVYVDPVRARRFWKEVYGSGSPRPTQPVGRARARVREEVTWG